MTPRCKFLRLITVSKYGIFNEQPLRTKIGYNNAPIGLVDLNAKACMWHQGESRHD
jgi:hypothetical protein